MAINTESPTTFTTSVLIGDAKPLNDDFGSSSPDNTPILSLAPNGEFVDAALEIQSTLGALLIPRMTTAEFNAFDAEQRIVNGMIVYESDTGFFRFRTDDDWANVGPGGSVIGPVTSTNNAIVRWNGVNGTTVKDSTVIIDNSANVTGVNSIRNGDGLIGAPSYAFTSDATTGMWSSTIGSIDFSAGGNQVLQLNSDPGDTNYIIIESDAAGNSPGIFVDGPGANIGMNFGTDGTGGFDFTTGNGLQASISDSGAAATGFITLNGGTTGVNSFTRITAGGTATNVGLDLYTKGAGDFDVYAGGFRQFSVDATASAVNYISARGAVAAGTPQISVLGTDANIGLNVQTKGTGAFSFLQSTTGAAGIARFWNNAGTFYTALQADVNLANLTLTLPITDLSANASASVNQGPLSTNGAGVLTFSNLVPRYATLTLTSAQIIGMNATPVTIAPAPGAGFMNVVIFFQANLIFNTTAYTGGGNFYIQYGTTGNSNFRATEVNGNAAFIRAASSSNYSIQGNISNAGGAVGLTAANSTNQVLSITNLTAAFATGNSTLKLQVWYTVVPTT